ncbi:MAG TPA: endonuclease/exonuclease/phosphatase family protein [Jatrophihabitantaceae bacterium]
MVRRNRILAALAGALIVAGSTIAVSAPAAAASQWPAAAPSHVRFVRATASSITVRGAPVANTTSYRLYVSTVKADVFYVNLHKPRRARHVASSRARTVTVGHLRYTSAPYYYRYAAVHGPNMRISGIRTAGVLPPVPAHLKVVRSSRGLYLTWAGEHVAGYRVVQARDPALRVGRRTYSIAGSVAQFTPYGLAAHRRYYFRVRAVNTSAGSGYSALVSVLPGTAEQQVLVMTYNLLVVTYDGRTEYRSEKIAPWSERKKASAALIKSGNPDVIAIEEGSDWTAGYRGPRQVDTLVAALGSRYVLARTETPPWSSHWVSSAHDKAGNYILYRTATWRAVGNGGHFAVGDGRFVAWQVLQNRGTGAKFLAVATHLIARRGAARNRMRTTETRNAIAGVARVNAARGNLPVVYAGDWNSPGRNARANNGPRREMASIRAVDAFDVAQRHTRAGYRSMNHYARVPPTGVYHIDRIFAAPGVAVRTWRQLLNLSHGRFVGVIPSDHNPVLAGLSIRYPV